MLRLLIKDITIVKAPEPKLLQLCIRWQGGTTETVAVHLPPNRVDAIRYPDTFVDRIRALELSTTTTRSLHCSSTRASQAQPASPSPSP